MTIPKPQYRELRFKNVKDFESWKKETAHVKIWFIDNGQDLLEIFVAKNGEIIDCNLQSFVWNGKIVDMKNVALGKGIWFSFDDEYKEMDFIVEGFETLHTA